MFAGVAGGGVPGQHQDRLVRQGPTDLAHRAEPVQAGHSQVDDQHIGPVPQGGVHRGRAVGRLGEHGGVALHRQQGGQGLAEQSLKVTTLPVSLGVIAVAVALSPAARMFRREPRR